MSERTIQPKRFKEQHGIYKSSEMMEHILKKYEEFCTKTDTGHWNMALLIGFDKGFNLCSQRYNKDG